MLFESLAAPHQVLAIGDLVEIDLGRQFPAVVLLVGSFASRAKTNRRMIVAVKRITVEAAVLQELRANFDQVIAPWPEIATKPRAQVILLGLDRQYFSAVVRMHAPIAMLKHQLYWRKRRRPQHKLHSAAVAGLGEGLEAGQFRLFKPATVAPQGKIRPDQVAVHNLRADVRRAIHLARAGERHSRHAAHPVGNFYRREWSNERRCRILRFFGRRKRGKYCTERARDCTSAGSARQELTPINARWTWFTHCCASGKIFSRGQASARQRS
jgi:hypothetical protein